MRNKIREISRMTFWLLHLDGEHKRNVQNNRITFSDRDISYARFIAHIIVDLLFIFRQHEKICSLSDFSVINRPTHIYIMWNVEKSIRLLLCEPFFFSVILFLFFFGAREQYKDDKLYMKFDLWIPSLAFLLLSLTRLLACSLKLITSSWNVKSRVLNDHTILIMVIIIIIRRSPKMRLCNNVVSVWLHCVCMLIFLFSKK